MTAPRTVAGYRFGIDVSPTLRSSVEPVVAAQAAEELRFDFLSVHDHFDGPNSRFEAWTLLAWIAASTTRIRVATRVLGLPYRHPVVLAKVARRSTDCRGAASSSGWVPDRARPEFEAIGAQQLGPLGREVLPLGDVALAEPRDLGPSGGGL